MTNSSPDVTVIGGVDTHKHTHYASVLDGHGRLLGSREFAATEDGYSHLLDWMQGLGWIVSVGVESTGSFGAVLAGTSTATPKAKSGTVEVIRTLRVARTSAVKARTQAFNTMWGIMISAPSPLRDELVVLTKRTFVNRCHGLRPETANPAALIDEPDRMLMAGVKATLRTLARRWRSLDDEIKELNRQIAALVNLAAPELLELKGVGVELAGQFLVTVGDNPDRIRSEAAFAKICGVAPQPASSGRTSGRHRLSRGGDRAANSALYIIAIVRMRHDPRTRAYVERRTAEGRTKREIIRCLKRYIAREVYKNLPQPRSTEDHAGLPLAA